MRKRVFGSIFLTSLVTLRGRCSRMTVQKAAI